jgi:GT2 family glycosyltransferase
VTESDYNNYKIIIIDNNSLQQTDISDLKKYCEKQGIDIILNEDNYGYAGGNNIGIHYAVQKYSPEYICILNNDLVLDRHCLSIMMEYAIKNPTCGIIGPKVFYYDRPKLVQSAGMKINWLFGKAYNIGGLKVDNGDKIPYGVDAICGCCMLIKREVIEVIGGFDEKYFCYWEDTDLCVRSRLSGYEVSCVPSAKVLHKTALKSNIFERSNNSKKAQITNYYGTRNNFMFMKKYCNIFQYIFFIIYFIVVSLFYNFSICIVFHRDMARFKSFYLGMLHGILRKYRTTSTASDKHFKILTALESD